MSKAGSQTQKTDDADEESVVSLLGHPAAPPQPNRLAFVVSLVLYLSWFVYLLMVARWG